MGKLPDLAPGADPAFARLVAMVRATPYVRKLPPRPPKVGPPPSKTPDRQSAFAKGWRERMKAAGGHVTNIVYDAQAWQAVRERVGEDRAAGAISGAACELIRRGAMLDDESLRKASEILAAYPAMGDLSVAVRVSIAHLHERIMADESYTISVAT